MLKRAFLRTLKLFTGRMDAYVATPVVATPVVATPVVATPTPAKQQDPEQATPPHVETNQQASGQAVL